MSRGWPLAALAVGLGGCAIQSNEGCPAGTNWTPAGLSELCEYPGGRIACTIWAQGFTPNRGDASAIRAYYVHGVPGLGPWCRNASSPPPGEG